MNVLVYSGNEGISTSFQRTVTHLRAHLYPNYTVQPITRHALRSQPWAKHCALLVFPALHNLTFSENETKVIDSFVVSGGSFLALSTGTEIFRRGPLPSPGLRFVNSQGWEFSPRFLPPPDTLVAKRVKVRFSDALEINEVEQAASISMASKDEEEQGFTPVANSVDHADGTSKVSALLALVGSGRVLLVAPSIESGPEHQAEERHQAFRVLLTSFGLPVSLQPFRELPPLPQYLTSSPAGSSAVSRLLSSTSLETLDHGVLRLTDANDAFILYPLASSTDADLKDYLVQKKADSGLQGPQIVVCPDTQRPSEDHVPHFDMHLFFEEIERRRQKALTPQDTLVLGDILLYGERVTSTQTLLEKNPQLLDSLPCPLVSIAFEQTAGRGRGGNVWLSPAGCLQMTARLRVDTAQLPSAKLVFVQYLFALAVTEACHSLEFFRPCADAIRLKWPNDIYMQTRKEGGDSRKIGGILVNTIFAANKVDILIGCGLNVTNEPPILSIGQLLPPESTKLLKVEAVAAAILTTFDKMWSQFVSENGSFDAFSELYLERWLHSDQVVTLTTVDPPKKVRILGITPDHGLLRTVAEDDRSPTPKCIDLQPDGNSFDLLEGLISTKFR